MVFRIIAAAVDPSRRLSLSSLEAIARSAALRSDSKARTAFSAFASSRFADALTSGYERSSSVRPTSQLGLSSDAQRRTHSRCHRGRDLQIGAFLPPAP